MSQSNENQTPANPQNDKLLANQTNVETGRESTDESNANVSDTAPPATLRSFFNLELFFDFLLILVTGVYAVFAYNQWRAIEKQYL